MTYHIKSVWYRIGTQQILDFGDFQWFGLVMFNPDHWGLACSSAFPASCAVFLITAETVYVESVICLHLIFKWGLLKLQVIVRFTPFILRFYDNHTQNKDTQFSFVLEISLPCLNFIPYHCPRNHWWDFCAYNFTFSEYHKMVSKVAFTVWLILFSIVFFFLSFFFADYFILE